MVAAVVCVFACLVAPGAGGKSKVTTIEVGNFGAVAGDGKSDTAAVMAAIEECRKHKPALLKFAKGQYDFFSEDRPKGGGSVFHLSGLDGVTIDGGGSTFMFHGYPGAFAFGDCRNVTVKNIIIDYVRPPFSLGDVIAVDGKSFDVAVDKDYPITGTEGVGAFMTYDRAAMHPAGPGYEEYSSCTSTELVKPQVMRVHLNHDATIKPGTCVLLRHAVYGPGACYVSSCTDFAIDNFTVHTTPGMAFVAGNSTNVTVRRLRVVPRPGSGWPMSATADGMHFSGCKGLIDIEGCEFQGMGDDAANIKSGLYMKVTEKLDDHTVLAQHNLKMWDPPSPGDKMEFARCTDLASYATLTVESVEKLGDGGKIRYKEPLPANMEIGDLMGNATRVAKVRIRNCEVRSNRARGFLLQNRDVVVENCKFTNCTMGGIWVLTECFYFYESIGSRDVVVRNCTFDNCGYWGGTCVLGAFVQIGPDDFPTVPGCHRNITLEGNVIRGADNRGIIISGVDGAVVRNNTIENVCRRPTVKSGAAAIYVTGSRNVRLTGNKAELAKQGASCKAAFELGPGVEKDTITTKGNVGF